MAWWRKLCRNVPSRNAHNAVAAGLCVLSAKRIVYFGMFYGLEHTHPQKKASPCIPGLSKLLPHRVARPSMHAVGTELHYPRLQVVAYRVSAASLLAPPPAAAAAAAEGGDVAA